MRSLGYTFCSVEKNGCEFWVRSEKCSGLLPQGQTSACLACQAVTEKVEHLARLAQSAVPHTRYCFLTHEQLRERLRERDELVQGWKLKVSYYSAV